MMWRLFFILLISAGLPVTAPAQTGEPDPGPPGEREDSQQVEESDEAFRRRMELEDARRGDPYSASAAAEYELGRASCRG